MGLRVTVAVCATSFLLGALFTHWIADALTLWKQPVTDANLLTAASYYTILTRGPVYILYVLGFVVLLGGSTLVWSLKDGEAINFMFDGGSIFLYVTTVGMYIYTVIPSILNNYSSIALPIASTVSPALRNSTLALASNNLISSVALTGVLGLQAARRWVSQGEDDDDSLMASDAEDESRTREPTPAPS